MAPALGSFALSTTTTTTISTIPTTTTTTKLLNCSRGTSEWEGRVRELGKWKEGEVENGRGGEERGKKEEEAWKGKGEGEVGGRGGGLAWR